MWRGGRDGLTDQRCRVGPSGLDAVVVVVLLGSGVVSAGHTLVTGHLRSAVVLLFLLLFLFLFSQGRDRLLRVGGGPGGASAAVDDGPLEGLLVVTGRPGRAVGGGLCFLPVEAVGHHDGAAALLVRSGGVGDVE